jgi:hypothetical protein
MSSPVSKKRREGRKCFLLLTNWPATRDVGIRSVRRPRSIPCVVGIGSGRRTPYWTAPDEKRFWGARLGKVQRPARPKSILETLWGTRLDML